MLTFGDGSIKVGLYTEDDYYPNIKLNQRTSKYLLDYPELDNGEGLDGEKVINDILEKFKKAQQK